MTLTIFWFGVVGHSGFFVIAPIAYPTRRAAAFLLPFRLPECLKSGPTPAARQPRCERRFAERLRSKFPFLAPFEGLEQTDLAAAILVVNLAQAFDMPRFAESWYLNFNATQFLPAMIPEDLQKAGLDELAKRWG